MTSSLQQQVRGVARQARRLVRWNGVGRFVAVTCVIGLVAGLIDYVARFQDSGVRYICFAVSCGIWAWAFVRHVYPAWRYRCSDLQAARRIEKRFPNLDDRLSSAVVFAEQSADDKLAGSMQLRQAVIAEAEALTEGLEFDACLDRRATYRALCLAAMAVSTILTLSFFDAASVGLAARRLLVPWGDDQWPRLHVLQFVDPPSRLAAGRDFEAELIDANGRLPDDVEIHYWFDGDDLANTLSHQMQPLGKKVTHRLAGVTRGFRYRATGGDDQQMPWIELKIVEPPTVVSKEIHLQPPDYTGMIARQADGSFRALVGTQATFRARVSKPISSAELVTDTTDEPISLSLPLDADRLGFSLPLAAATQWVISRSGSYGFRLVDQQGLDVGVDANWGVDAVTDLPPTVSLNRPTADLLATARAVLNVEAIVKDDLAIRSVELTYVRSTRGAGGQTIPLWAGPATVATISDRDQSSEDDGVQRTVTHGWDLASLTAVEEGESIEFYVSARDYKDQVGQSVLRRVTIISAEELEEQVSQRQADVLTQVAEITRLQRQTQSQIADLQIQLRSANGLARGDIDQLQSAELSQRQVHQRLGHPNDGVASQLAELLHEMESNRFVSPGVVGPLSDLLREVQKLTESPLPRIQHRLVDSLRIARDEFAGRQRRDDQATDRKAQAQLTDMFQRVHAEQQQVIEALEAVLGRLNQWDSYQRLAREVARLRREQSSVRQRTEELRLDTLTKELTALSPQEVANLRRMTERQNDLALRFDALKSRIQSTREQLTEKDPTAAATLADAADMIGRVGIGGGMRDAARAVESNRLGQAAAQQEWAVQQLAQLQDILANRREYQLDRRIDRLEKAASDLQQIEKRQEKVQEKSSRVASGATREFQELAQEESQIGAEAGGIARRLNRLGAGAAENSVQQAMRHLANASQAALGADDAQLRREAERARATMAQAQQQLQDAVRSSQQDLQDERIRRLRQILSEFIVAQQGILSDTQDIDETRQTTDVELTAQQIGIVQALAKDQLSLRNRTEEMAESIEDTEAFAFALRDAEGNMADAGTRLQKRLTGDETQQFESLAETRLRQVLEAIQDQPSRDSDGEPNSGSRTGTEENSAKVPRNNYLAAQLKLIRIMQVELNRRTVALHEQPNQGDDDRRKSHQDLVQQQSQLAQILSQLMEAAKTERE